MVHRSAFPTIKREVSVTLALFPPIYGMVPETLSLSFVPPMVGVVSETLPFNQPRWALACCNSPPLPAHIEREL